jgi:glycosyltransferase involved in cell wall biosynthesis
MKVACISHGAIVPLNRRPYDLLATAHGIEITVIVPELWAGDLPSPAIRFTPAEGGAACLALPVVRSGNGSLFRLRGLAAALRALAPDVVLLDEEPWSLVAWQVLRAGLEVPTICYSKQNIVKRMPPPFSWIRRAAYRRVRSAWAVGETTAEVLRATGFARPVDLVPHGVEVSAFTPGRDAERRRTLGLDGVVIGYAGRLVEEKGIAELLEAARRLAADAPVPFTLLVVGAGPLAAAVERAAATPGARVRLLPAVPHHEAPALYRLMDVFVLPSRETPRWREQFGRVLVEAAATALPIVAAATGEIPFVMRALGFADLLVPPEDPLALASALRRLLADPARRAALGMAGLDRARAAFAQEAVAGRMAVLLHAAQGRA